MSPKYFILIPSPHPTGPIKGAYALANALATKREVTLVALKPGPGVNTFLDHKVRSLTLANAAGGWLSQVRAYRQLLRNAGDRNQIISISMCLSADLVNRFSRSEARICSSVRGNLIRNYRMEYGIAGVPLAISHLLALNGFDNVVAMTNAMARQVCTYISRYPVVIGNFVDETALEHYRNTEYPIGPKRFVFLASLSWRKQPLLLVKAIQQLRQSGTDVMLDIIGSGPLMPTLQKMVNQSGLSAVVNIHGQLADPYSLLAAADTLVIPSLSEGVSRAALEALYLGVPCVLRDIDGNSDLISHGVNGCLFKEDNQLAGAMHEAATISRVRSSREILLPSAFRQTTAAQEYIDLMELMD